MPSANPRELWLPILPNGDLAQRVNGALDDVAEALASGPISRSVDLAEGPAGVALFFHYLNLARPGEGHGGRARARRPPQTSVGGLRIPIEDRSMHDSDFDWNRSYVIPADLIFRLTPAGNLQVDGGAGVPSIEIPRDWVPLVLAFARAGTPEAVYEAVTEDWEVDRESFQGLLQTWTAQGLLRLSGTGDRDSSVPSRLALFMQAAAAGTPLRSHFPLQRPLELYPGLDTREIHDRGRFPWVAELEGAFPVIQAEFARLAETGSGFSPVYRSQTSTGEWAASYLWVFGKQVEETCRLCPETTRLLSAIPGVAEFGTTMYSGLAPHTHIAPHYGYSNAKLRCQLPLRVPALGHCRLKVGEHEIEQREGKCIVFDDSFLHSAWNDSDEPRFVLVFDFFHPDLTVEEVQYLARLASERELAKGYLREKPARVDWVR